MKKKSGLKLMAVIAVTTILAAGCGNSNAAPAKEDAVTETVQATAEEANAADETNAADGVSSADTAIGEVPSVSSEGETGSETDAVEETTVEAETTAEAASKEEAAETEQAEAVTSEPRDGDTVIILYEGNEISATFLNKAEELDYIPDSQGGYVYDILGRKCVFKQPVSAGRIDYEKLPEEWQSMVLMAYSMEQKESGQDAAGISEPEEGDVTTVKKDGKEIKVTFLGKDGEKYIYDMDGVTVKIDEILEKGVISFEDLPKGWTVIMRSRF